MCVYICIYKLNINKVLKNLTSEIVRINKLFDHSSKTANPLEVGVYLSDYVIFFNIIQYILYIIFIT